MGKATASYFLKNDYLNEYSKIMRHVLDPGNIPLREGACVHKFWDRYSEEFPHKIRILYDFEVTADDEKIIKELDDLADLTNSELSADQLDYDKLKVYVDKALQLCGRESDLMNASVD